MYDLYLSKVCPHRIFDERLTLQGASPNYFAILNYGSNGDPSAFDVRDWASTEGLTGYLYAVNGVSNWSLSADGTQINFNTQGLGGSGTGVASFVDGSTMIQPAYVYVASYTALDTTCPLHTQAGPQYPPIQRDININTQGQLTTIEGEDKVRQMVTKAILTAVGSNTFHTDYGSWLSTAIGSKFDIMTQMTIQQSVQTSVDYLITQQQQSTVYIPPEETIFRVSSVNVSKDPTTPTMIRVSVDIMTGTYKNVTVGLGVSL